MSKKLMYLLSVVLVLAVVSDASADLVGYWKLDEGAGTTVADSSGAGHNGVFAEGTPEWVEGMFGKALKFNGSNKVEIPDHPDFHLEDAVSMALWIKPEAGQPDYAKPFIKQKSGEYPYAIQYSSNGESIRATVNASARFDTSTTPNFVGQWGHLCMTYDGSAVILYKDAEEVARIAASGKLQQNDLSLSIGGRLGSSQNFIGVIDDVRLYSRALTVEEIRQVIKGPPAGPASKPSPDDGQTDVPLDVVLSWTPREYAPPTNVHKVYFSENFNDISDGVGGATQDANSYTPPQRLDFGTTYYWRVDEVNGPPDNTVFEGNIWSFTTEPLAYAVENITGTASSNEADKGPENTVNSSGLDDSGLLHGNEGVNTMWLSSRDGTQPTWIEYEFDNVYKLHEMWVWNSNESLEPMIGLGFKDVSIDYSVNGTDYTTLGTTHEFARAPGAADYAHNTTIDLGGVAAKYVRLTANSNWGGILDQFGLSEVRFFSIPVQARGPNPASGATDVGLDLVLGFRAGREAAKHDVYFSSDEQAVIDGTASVTTVTETIYDPLALDLGTTYYWRVDEANEAETPAMWQGEVWSFTTNEYLVVDDFEDYDIGNNEIWWAWIDGLGYASHPTLPSHPGNGTGSMVGDETTPSYTEETIVHGGSQSMPVFYDNSILRYSEVEKTLTYPRDWTEKGISTLTIWFRGDSANAAETLYVALNGSAVVNHDNPNAAQIDEWTEWNIDLQVFADQGVNLANVNTIALGLGNKKNPVAGGSGTMYIDDIRLYRPAPEQAP